MIKRNLCIFGIVVAAIIGIVVLVVVILAFTVFKPKQAVTTLNSLTIKDLDVSLDFVGFPFKLNITLEADISVNNPNQLGFNYDDAIVFLNYRGEVVGESSIPAGIISAHQTKRMNLTLTIMADRFLSKSQLLSDVFSGTLPLNSYVRLSGKVSILIVKLHVVSTTSCDFAINVSNSTIGAMNCNYYDKL